MIINNQNEDNSYCQIYIALLSHIIYSFDIIKSIIKSKEPQSFLQTKLLINVSIIIPRNFTNKYLMAYNLYRYIIKFLTKILWWFEMIFLLGQLDKCGWNPSPGFDEVQSGVDISSWVKQLRFFQLGHFKRKSNLNLHNYFVIDDD